eukprot:gene10890-9911_t
MTWTSDYMFVTGSDDATLRLWPAPHVAWSSKPVHTFLGHKNGVWSVASWSVWDLNSGELLHTMEGHTHTVRCVKMLRETAFSSSRDRQYILSGSYDNDVKIWSFKDNPDNVCHGTLSVWDFDTFSCKHTLAIETTPGNHPLLTTCMVLKRNILLS